MQTDQDTKLSPLAWLALFDLLQRADDRVGFDLLAMQFVLQFERSAPSWNERSRPPTDDKPGGGELRHRSHSASSAATAPHNSKA